MNSMNEKSEYRVAVVGSRSITAADLEKYIPASATMLLSGGAVGVDRLAERYAASHGLPIRVIPPDYALFGRSAPLIRDRQIVDEADLVIAVWDGSSPGTRYTVEYARRSGTPLRLYIV